MMTIVGPPLLIMAILLFLIVIQMAFGIIGYFIALGVLALGLWAVA